MFYERDGEGLSDLTKWKGLILFDTIEERKIVSDIYKLFWRQHYMGAYGMYFRQHIGNEIQFLAHMGGWNMSILCIVYNIITAAVVIIMITISLF